MKLFNVKNPILYFLLFALLVISCNDDDDKQELHTRLKRKIQVDSPVSTLKVVWEYHYDLSGRLDKITSGNWFEEKYIYDNYDQLINKKVFHYANDEMGWLINDSSVYKYADGKLSEELKYGSSNELYLRIEYEYENSKLIKKTTFFTESEYSIINYEYSGQLCIKEKMGSGSKVTDFIVHYYSEGKLQLSERYNIRYDSSNSLLQQIIYTYNENGDLVLEEAIQIEQELVANLNYTFKYEYEEFYN
jgi:hypothetical protein